MINSILRMLECVSRDLIAVNSVRNANATAVTASATAAAAIAAATAAAQVEAQTAANAALTISSLTSTLAPPILIQSSSQNFNSNLHISNVRNEVATNSQVDHSSITLQSSNVDAEMSELRMSPVLQNVGDMPRGFFLYFNLILFLYF